jgi:predicted small lipoprotein YifL
MPVEQRQPGDHQASATRNRRDGSASRSPADLGARSNAPRLCLVGGWRLLRWTLGLAAITALAACGEGDPLGFGGVGTEAVKPTINLQLTPSTVAMGQSATLTWSASNAQSCAASGGWSGAQPTSGNLSTAPLTANTSYTLTCTGSGGAAAQSTQAVVKHPAPVVKLAASPTTIDNLGSSTLTWFATNA